MTRARVAKRRRSNALRRASGEQTRQPVYFTQEDPIGLAGGMNLYGYANGDPINFSDPFGLSACPPLCDSFDPREDRFITPSSGREALVLGGLAIGAATGGVGIAIALTSSIAVAPVAAGVGPGTLKLIDALKKAGPSMDARVSAVSKWLPEGQKALQTTLEGGGRMLSGGAGARARQVILNADGSTVVNAFNPTKKVWEMVETITP